MYKLYILYTVKSIVLSQQLFAYILTLHNIFDSFYLDHEGDDLMNSFWQPLVKNDLNC